MNSFDHATIQDFVSFQLRRGGGDGHALTLKELSARLGLKSPSLISMIANGKRLPSEKVLEQLFDLWKISAKQRKLLRLQLKLEKKHQKGKDALVLLQEIRKLDPPSEFYKLKLSEIESIRDWHVLVVRALANNAEFVNDPQWISQRLRNKISPTQAKKAMALLIDRGLLRAVPGSAEVIVNQDAVETSHDVPSESIRHHHRGMMQRALEALTEQSVTERSFNSVTFNFNPDDIEAAKKRLLDFAKSFHDEFGQNASDSVYQLNLQFFSHTSPKGRQK